MTAEAEVDVPDVAEPLLGFRVWRWNSTALTLHSVTVGAPTQRRQPLPVRQLLAAPLGAWKPGETLAAECAGRQHPAPDPKCSCGTNQLHPI